MGRQSDEGGFEGVHSRSSSPAPPTEGTLYERKCAVVNREIDRMGMGRYQWAIWWLCGFGYLLDLLWAQCFGLIVNPLQQELGFNSDQSGNIQSSFSAGLTAGAAFWGILVDIIGRQWAFNMTVMFSSVFGLALAGSQSYETFLVITAFVGFGVGGNIPIDTTITLEFIPQPIGVVITSAFAYAYVPEYGCKPDFLQDDALPSCNTTPAGQPCCRRENNWGWRYLVLTVGSITMFVFILRFVVFRFQESPKYLLYRGQDEKAATVLQKIAKFNKQESKVTLATFEALTTEQDSMGSGTGMLGGGSKQLQATTWEKVKLELARYKLLFETWTMTRLTTLIFLIYICDYWGFTVAQYFLPQIVAAKNSAAGALSLKATYRSYVWIYLPGIAGVLAGVLCYELTRLGRQITMVGASAMMGVSLFLFATINSYNSNIGLNVMEYFFQSMFNAVLYGWTPEAFPAPIRGTACGLASFWGRLFSIVSPLIAQHLLTTPPGESPTLSQWNHVLYLAGGVTFGCVIFAALLPHRMIGSDSM
ncbi:MAG: hypothetical protein Q9162_001016 [Coniocarpon cinnabarinum]